MDLCWEESFSDVLLQQRRKTSVVCFSCSRAPSICPALELTMFAAGQKDGNVIVILNLFISSGTKPFIFLPLPNKWDP